MAYDATVWAASTSIEKGLVGSGFLVPSVLLPVLWLVIMIMPRVFGSGRTVVANVDSIQCSGGSEDDVLLKIVLEGN